VIGEPKISTDQSNSELGCGPITRTNIPRYLGFLHRLTIAKSPGSHRRPIQDSLPRRIAPPLIAYCMHEQYQSSRARASVNIQMTKSGNLASSAAPADAATQVAGRTNVSIE
jgi:hypothetical protein